MKIDVYQKKKQQITIISILLIVIVFAFSSMTQFDWAHSIRSIPEAANWIVTHLFITQQAMTKMPLIIDKLIETIFLSITSTMTASIVALFLALCGSQTTRVHPLLSTMSRLIASFFRNIPVVAWALILLLSFGQHVLTGYLALFLATLGFLTRVFTETIDEKSTDSVEALKATGATYFQVVTNAVIPNSSPQMISWILFMIETNIRSSTLVGILTGTGIGFTFDIYYKSMNYDVVALITLSIVVVVIGIEVISNYIRRITL